VAKRKPTTKKPTKKAPRKPVAKAAKTKTTTAKAVAKPAPVVDAAPVLAKLGFFRGEYHWELERHIPAFDTRVRLLVDHIGGVVTAEQARAVELLLETETPLRTLALRAAYELMLRWAEGYRKRHPDFRGKPIGEKPFFRGCELKTVLFPSPGPTEMKPPPRFVLSLFWPDDTRPCEVRFEWVKGEWVVTQCERN
jgi:hypothetical protein